MKLVSIIIPNQNQRDLLKGCIDSILQNTSYSNYEIIIVENGSTEEKVFDYYKHLTHRHSNITVITYEDSFNFSDINNYASIEADGEYLLFLNNDTVVITDHWLTSMVNVLKNKVIGAVGATLLYSDEKIQHMGVTLSKKWIAFHHNHESPVTIIEEEKYNKPMVVDAVTGACLLTKKSLFVKVNGFDVNLPIAYNDVDYCLKLRELDYKIGWTPKALLFHYESTTRGHDNTPEKIERLTKESEYMRNKWKKILQ